MRQLVLIIAVLATFSSPARAAEISADEILAGADERIEQYRKASAVLKLMGPSGAPLAEGINVQISQTQHDFLFGANIYKFDKCKTPDDNAAYKENFRELFNFATLAFYWSRYEPDPGKTEFRQQLKVAQWCRQNNIRAKGHPLVWTLEPDWPARMRPATAQSHLWERIAREVMGFSRYIDTWDVLNEPCVGLKQAKERNAATILGLYTQMGEIDVITKAFGYARNAGQNATLILNDYDTSNKYERTVQACLDQGVSIDAIGIQSHMHRGYWPVEKTWDVCQRFGRFGKPLHFTEVTITSGPKTEQQWKTTDEGEKLQAANAKQFYRLLFSNPDVEAITWWDLSDQGAWQKAPAGLLREDMTAKPAYEALKDLIKDKWWTQTSATTQTDGTISFRGFKGQYSITANINGKELTATTSLRKDTPKPTELTLK